tara:strand:+ start:506 stop:1183 length:678 start_codon:yes stop_codon:yes gene_type:complete
MSSKKKIHDMVSNYRAYNKQSLPYQSMGGIKGIRDTRRRLKVLKFPKNFSGKTVLDIGCSTGIFCFEAHKRRASRCVGIDYSHEPINIANAIKSKLPNANGLEFYVCDLNMGIPNLLQIIGPFKYDYIFALSIWKHIYDDIFWNTIKLLCKDTCYLEFNSIHDGSKHPTTLINLIKNNRKNKKLLSQIIMQKSGCKDVKFLGFAKDSGKRACFSIKFKNKNNIKK